MYRRFLVVAAFVLAFAGATSVSQAAPAEPEVFLGGGSGILLPDFSGSNPDLSTADPSRFAACSLTAVGYNNAGSLIGLTAGHCAHVGDRVVSEFWPEAGAIGKFVYVSQVSDISVIDLDDAKVAPLKTVGGTTINVISPAPPFGTPVCKEGRSTGHTCAWVWGYSDGDIIEQTCAIPGDSGGPLTVGDRLVGLISYGPPPFCYEPFPPPFHAPDFSADINIGIADINARGGGFTLF
ncbi:MAG: S1 family peptidase [Mycobacteriaceae bacterium]